MASTCGLVFAFANCDKVCDALKLRLKEIGLFLSDDLFDVFFALFLDVTVLPDIIAFKSVILPITILPRILALILPYNVKIRTPCSFE
jgi:hypothetical protein